MDLKYEVQALGQVSLDGVPIQSAEYLDTLNLFAPFPLLGVDYWSRVTDRWHVGGEFTFIAGSYNNTEALVFNVALRTRRQLTERLGAEFGLSILSADAEVTRPNTVRDIKYAYEGVYVGFDFRF